jgi:GWxTD domain-containing protein
MLSWLSGSKETLLKTTIPGVLVAVALFAAGLRAAPEKITPDLARWLEDVSPILTKTERSVFLKLTSNADRAKFVRLFWRMRDPLPDTDENEFQKEYEARIRFADQNFGHYSPKRGSQTDRGFFYVLLGPPRERRQFTTQSEIWPLELWLYEGDVQYGLPGHFYLIFYQPEGIGDFRLYSPSVEGPEKLAVPALGDGVSVTRRNVLNAIKHVSSELARASQSYLPGEAPMGTGSFSSDTLIASIRGLPEKKFSDAYARSYVNFKDYIETDYTDSFVQSAFQVRVFREGGQAFLHWSIEPERMSFAAQGDNMVYAAFELVLRIEDGRGATIYERTEEIPLKITSQTYQALSRQRFAFQDLLAVIPGQYRALFLLKNKTTRDFSSFETGVSVAPPEPAGRAGLSGVLLFHARTAVPAAQARNLKAFAFGGRQYVVSARNEFTPSSTLGVFLQARNVAALVPGGSPFFVLDVVSADTNESVGRFPLTEIVPDPDDPAALLVSGTVPLKDFVPGYYRAEVSLRDGDGQPLLGGQENFVILSRPVPVVPQVYARLHGPFPGPEHLLTVGSQYFLAGDYPKAQEAFEKVLARTDDPDARLLLAKALYGQGRFKESLDQAAAVYERTGDRESAKVMALDHAGLKEWDSALSYLEKLMAEATEIPVLNLAAECYLAVGRPERALPLIEKSLSLLPDQPAVKALEEKARKRLPSP